MLLERYIKVINVLGLFLDMLSMGFYTTRHWQKSGRLVQELDVCTVYYPFCSKTFALQIKVFPNLPEITPTGLDGNRNDIE